MLVPSLESQRADAVSRHRTPASHTSFGMLSRSVRPGQRLEALERVRAPLPPPNSRRAEGVPAAPPLEVVFEDEHLACVAKPQDVPTQVSNLHSVIQMRCCQGCIRRRAAGMHRRAAGHATQVGLGTDGVAPGMPSEA